MLGLPLGFTAPIVLAGLLALPLIWLLLRMTPPKPNEEVFPPLHILLQLDKHEETPHRSPWWLTALRILLAALAIIALAGPLLNPNADLQVSSKDNLIIILDDGWAAQDVFASQSKTAETLLKDANDKGQLSSLIALSDGAKMDLGSQTAEVQLERLAALRPNPARLNINNGAGNALTRDMSGQSAEIIYLSSGVQPDGWNEFSKLVAADSNWTMRIFQPAQTEQSTITQIRNTNADMEITIASLGGFPKGDLIAYDDQSRALGAVEIANGAPLGEGRLQLSLSLPLELRNDIARVVLETSKNAGGTYLLNEGSKRRRVAMLSGVSNELAQPLLEPLHYISRALSPVAEVKLAQEANLVSEVIRLLDDSPSVFVLADVGTLPEEATEALYKFVEDGGTLLRFAGPRLAGSELQDPLIPVLLRQGERALGGSLSWDKPQPLAPFPAESPFRGIALGDDISIKRQVLAEPDIELVQKTWASLGDNTPLVTAQDIGRGSVILFHVTADATWSNLPLSGTFVAMLTRIIERAKSSGGSAPVAASQEIVLPPLKTISADGRFGPPPPDARPLTLKAGDLIAPSLTTPPGQYGTKAGFTTLNLFDETRDGEISLQPINLSDLPSGAVLQTYPEQTTRDLTAWFFGGALLLLALDSLIMIWMHGGLRSIRRKTVSASVAILAAATLSAAVFSAVVLNSGPAFAQSSGGQSSVPNKADDDLEGLEKTLAAVFETRIAYVITGDRRTDDVSEAGLTGLTRFIASRTALEPGQPIGIDISSDELSFFPLIYWPISADAQMPAPATLARLDAYMKKGGTVLFDTRNGLSTRLNRSGSQSPTERRLADILADLDIPPLEPVPSDHVLTKAFYLLDSFPGRFNDSPLWVEALPILDESVTVRPARAGDGVSSVLISGNDLAGAWAIDQAGRPMLPTTPDDPRQRVLAYRTGVNIMMYTLTGNYKADQIHIPDLLERLGQ